MTASRLTSALTCIFTACGFFSVLPAWAGVSEIPREQVEFFEAKVRPVLVQHCYECHSTEGKKAKGGLTLDTRDGLLKGGDSGPSVVPGQPDKSLLVTAVRHADDELKMPKRKLQQHEIDALAEWVRMGAPDPRVPGAGKSVAQVSRFDWASERQHWAYQPIVNPAPPPVKDAAWPRSDIDRFILAKLESTGLKPANDADGRTLIRRASFDLTGLPPTPEEVEAFARDYSSDPRQSMERLVDSLLSRPQYGERWGRHWMDLVRYADTAGDNSDYPIPQAYLYRNYIIDAFNKDKPYDQFVREQIAGDLLDAKDQKQRDEQVIATGYIAMSRRFGSLADRYPYHLTIEDTLDNIGKTFLGLTLACARCHDHKFDAITQADYYGLYGIFASTKYAFPGIELLKIQKDFVPLLPKEEVDRRLADYRVKERELEKQADIAGARRKEIETEIRQIAEAIGNASDAKKKDLTERTNVLRLELDKARKQIRAASTALEAHERTRPKMPDAYAVQDQKKPVEARIQLKGEPEKLGDEVPRRWLELFGAPRLPPEIAARSSGRQQLAEWMVEPANPLTARVIVNRVWQYHFGTGLVGTPNDFGVRGLPPTHPELLDHLATAFVGDGWSFKKLHKRIMLSRVYQLAGTEDDAALAIDPSNQLRWRFSRQRLTAESLRDTLLQVTGALDQSPQEKPYPFPPQDKWTFTQHHPFRADYPSDKRSVYLMSARLTASPFFQSFDGPDPNASTPRRDSSVTTVQALYWLNDGFLHQRASAMADRLMKERSTDEERVRLGFELVIQRPPTGEEAAMAFEFLKQVRERVGEPSEKDKAALTSFARAIFRTNEFLYVD